MPNLIANVSASVIPASPVVAYVTEEVARQGHDVRALDGIQRVRWMLDAWTLALLWHAPPSGNRPLIPTLYEVIELGQRIEPEINRDGLRHCGVRVGAHIAPSHAKVKQMLGALLERQTDLTPLAFYREFETIHPFIDGNGRTGKVLLNWLNDSLLNPIFPPADFWGAPIRNP